MVEPGVSHWCPTSYDMNDVAELKQEELSQAERAGLEGIVWRKLDRWILPLCTSFFFLSFLVCL